MDITSGYIKVRSWRTWIFFYPGLCTLYKITLLKQAIITNSALDWLSRWAEEILNLPYDAWTFQSFASPSLVR